MKGREGGHVEHVTATISSCQPEERLHAKRGSPNPPNENKRQTQGERTRARRSRRGRADAVPSRPVPFGRAALGTRTGWMRSPSRGVDPVVEDASGGGGGRLAWLVACGLACLAK